VCAIDSILDATTPLKSQEVEIQSLKGEQNKWRLDRRTIFLQNSKKCRNPDNPIATATAHKITRAATNILQYVRTSTTKCLSYVGLKVKMKLALGFIEHQFRKTCGGVEV
jgi:hypothetical protein